MAARPEFWIVAGPNGAGKTTCCQRAPIRELIPGLRVLNPDDRTLQSLQLRGYRGFADTPVELLAEEFIRAADAVFAELQHSVHSGVTVGVETVLSTNKYRELIEVVLQRGTYFGMIYIALASPDLACERVAARVSRGGHDVPLDRTRLRWQKSLDQLPWFASRADDFWIIDNSDSQLQNEPRLVAYGDSGRPKFISPAAFPKLLQVLTEPADWRRE